MFRLWQISGARRLHPSVRHSSSEGRSILESAATSIQAESEIGLKSEVNAVEDDFELEFDRQEIGEILSLVHRS
jgi:hypothetical protein